ncbi:MAG: hypothetical protein FJY29_10060 [Betaproteobacteria bacterium]|nr:hypothetical protein [Betaproteobacteria bacterium]
MLELIHVDDIFTVYPEVFVHPVNCVGVSKDILSRQVKKSWPDYFREYTRSCIRKKLLPGEPLWHEVGELFGTRFVVALPLKNHWQEKMRPDVTRQALGLLFEGIFERQLGSAAVPVFEGPPPGWLEKEITRLCEGQLHSTLHTVYLFNTTAV